VHPPTQNVNESFNILNEETIRHLASPSGSLVSQTGEPQPRTQLLLRLPCVHGHISVDESAQPRQLHDARPRPLMRTRGQGCGHAGLSVSMPMWVQVQVQMQELRVLVPVQVCGRGHGRVGVCAGGCGRGCVDADAGMRAWA
jgi:hypothetical protein